jgi:cytochrome c5
MNRVRAAMALAGALFILGGASTADVQACGPQVQHHGHAGAVLPQAMNQAALPDAQLPGARLLGSYCTQCHGLPNPALHSAEEWPAVAERMYGRMQLLSPAGRVRKPDAREFEAIVDYLQTHAGGASPVQPSAALSLLTQ